MSGRLPVTLPPDADELLSSWIGRHADFYGVSALTMLRHCLPEAASLRTVDFALSNNQAKAIAEMFSIDAKTVLGMIFSCTSKSMNRFIAKEPIHRCVKCNPSSRGSVPILRSQLQGWRITCPQCGNWLHDETEAKGNRHALAPYRNAALRGEKLLHNEAEHGIETWISPLDLARLLLMRRIPWPFPRPDELWRYRVLGVLIPEFDAILSALTSFHRSPKHPILPLHIRPALLAGVDIVHRSGPEMLRMLQGHTFGANREKFIKETDHLISPAFGLGPPRQMQLI